MSSSASSEDDIFLMDSIFMKYSLFIREDGTHEINKNRKIHVLPSFPKLKINPEGIHEINKNKVLASFSKIERKPEKVF